MALTPHVHIGFIDFVTFFVYLLIAGALIRIMEVAWHGNIVGQALSFIY